MAVQSVQRLVAGAAVLLCLTTPGLAQPPVNDTPPEGTDGGPPPDDGAGGGPNSGPAGTPCAQDGSDYSYSETLSSNIRTVVTNHCPNHPYYNLNPNYAVNEERNYTIPTYPRFVGSGSDTSIDSSHIDLSAWPGEMGVIFSGAQVYSPYGGMVQVTSFANSAVYAEGNTFDQCGGHASSTSSPSYHVHQPPACLLGQLGATSSAHSPQIGWAFDGFPLYGPRGPGGVMMQRCSITGGTYGTDVCTDECAGYYNANGSIDDYVYRYYMLGSYDESGASCSLPACPAPDASYHPSSPMCFRGCCPTGVTCHSSITACPDSTIDGNATADFTPTIPTVNSLSVETGLPMNDAACKCVNLTCSSCSEKAYSEDTCGDSEPAPATNTCPGEATNMTANMTNDTNATDENSTMPPGGEEGGAPPPEDGGAGGGAGAGGDDGAGGTPCAQDGSDYSYSEALSGDLRTVVTNHCPNHPHYILNPNYAVNEERTYAIPAYPQFVGTGKETSIADSHLDLSAYASEVGIFFSAALLFSPYAGRGEGATSFQDSAVYGEGETFDSCGCHSSMSTAPTYHCHQPPACLLGQLGATTSAHSPHIGWAFDGFPIYGPRGPGGVMMQRCSVSGGTYGVDVCTDECAGYYKVDSSIDDYVYRYYMLGPVDESGTSCSMPACPSPGESYHPSSPICFRGCCPAGATCHRSISACPTSGVIDGHVAGFTPTVPSVNDLSVASGLPLNEAACKCTDLACSTCSNMGYMEADKCEIATVNSCPADATTTAAAGGDASGAVWAQVPAASLIWALTLVAVFRRV